MKLVSLAGDQPVTSVADGVAIALRKIEELEAELLLLQSQCIGTSNSEIREVKSAVINIHGSLNLYGGILARCMKKLLND